MATEKRGRPPLKKGQALMPIRVFVMEKYLTRAKKEVAAIVAKYRV